MYPFFQAFVIAYTSDFIPRMVYMLGYSQNNTLEGYIDSSLSCKYNWDVWNTVVCFTYKIDVIIKQVLKDHVFIRYYEQLF